MPLSPLSEDEFRLLAFMRGYADRCEQGLEPNWIREQLEFTVAQMQRAARTLATRGLVDFTERLASEFGLKWSTDVGNDPVMCDIRVTERGWKYLREANDVSQG